MRQTQKKTPPIRQWVWEEVGTYDGLFLPDRTPGEIITTLKPYLSLPMQILEAEQGVFVLFEQQQSLDPKAIGHALALKSVGPKLWASYPEAHVEARAERHFNVAMLFYAGQPMHVDLGNAKYFDLAALWQLDDVRMEEGQSLPVFPTAETAKSHWAYDAPGKPSASADIASLDKMPEALGDIRQATKGHPESAAEQVANPSRRLAMILFRLTFTACLVAAILLLLLAMFVFVIEGTSGRDGSLARDFIIIAVLVALIWFLLNVLRKAPQRYAGAANGSGAGSGVGSGDGGKGANPDHGGPAGPEALGDGEENAVSKEYKPGLVEKLRGWVIWNTPAGDRLRKSLEDRLEETEDLLNKGRVDEALKKAIALKTHKGGKPQSLSSKLPDVRSSLDLNFGKTVIGGTSFIGSTSFDTLQEKYTKLAQSLKSQGDYRRAAFVYDELLERPRDAVSALQEGEHYKDAAKLATARQLNQDIIIRLWYQAGERDLAIALAKRYDMMGELVRSVENKNKDAGRFLRRVWAEQLAGAGDYAQALLVTDTLSEEKANRQIWLSEAIKAEDIDTPTIFHRAVTNLPWDAGPLMGRPSEIRSLEARTIEAKLKRCFERTPKAQAARQALLAYITQDINTTSHWDKEVLQGQMGPLCDLLIRTALADGEPASKKSLRQWAMLSKKVGLPVLAVDLQMIKRNPPTPTIWTEISYHLPEPAIDRPKWTLMAALPRRRVLLAEATGLIRILDETGRTEWGDQLTDLVGFVPIRTGRYVLLVLNKTSMRRILRFDTMKHSYSVIGALEMENWHEAASENLWLVKSSKRIHALDVAALLDDKDPRFEENWGIALNEEVKLLAFSTSTTFISWYVQHLEQGRWGLIERWQAPKSTLDFSVHLIDPNQDIGRCFYTHPVSFWQGHPYFEGEATTPYQTSYAVAYSRADELKIKRNAADLFDALKEAARFSSVATGPLCVTKESENGETVRFVPSDRDPEKRVTLSGPRRIASGTSGTSKLWIVLDDQHRVIWLDAESGTIWSC